MTKRHSLLTAIFAVLMLSFTALAQEAELAANSNLTGASLPNGAVRLSEQSVPADIKNVLSKLVAAGAGQIRQGNSEVLAWTGAGYKKSDAPRLMQQLESTLRTDGWTYEVAAKEAQVVVFNLLNAAVRRGIVGLFMWTDDALVLAWTELLPINSSAPAASNAGATAIPRELIGKWDNGGVSMHQYRDTVTGSTTPGRGSYFAYDIKPDGSFQFVGTVQSTMFGCATAMYNEKAGQVEISGSTITFILTKNFWRKTNNCAPNSNSERDYTLERETYQWRIQTDEYGKQLLYLRNGNGESRYRLKEE